MALTRRDKKEQNRKENNIRPDTGHREDGTQYGHGDQEEGECSVELRLVQPCGGGRGGRVGPVGTEAWDDGGAKGEPEAAEHAEDCCWECVSWIYNCEYLIYLLMLVYMEGGDWVMV